MRIAYIKFLAAVLFAATSLVCLGQEPTSKNPRGLYKMTRLTGREDNAEKQRQTQQKKLLAMIPDGHLSVGTGSDTSILKVDTIQNKVIHGVHVIHDKMEYFGDKHTYSLPEQENTLRQNYDGKDRSGMMSWEHNKEIETDLLTIRDLARNLVISMGKEKLLKMKYRMGIKIAYNSQGDILYVSTFSAFPLHRKMGYSNIRKLIREISASKIHPTSVDNQNLYFEAAVMLF